MMVKEELGEEWLSNHWFRFGASSLANDILIVAEGGRRALSERGLLLERLAFPQCVHHLGLPPSAHFDPGAIDHG